MTKQEAIAQISKDIREHTCSLRAGCIQAVPGDGSPDSEIVFIGEGPGKVEDEQGRPFVGPAGKVLDKLLLSIGMQRSDVYITNVVKCRPPENRDPSPSEVAEHAEFLAHELELIKPKLIVLLGRHALHWFLPNEQIGKVRGRAKRQGDKIFFPVYHPAAVLHNPPLMKDLQEDFNKIPVLLKKIDELPPVAANVESDVAQSTLFEIK
ncbi:uracil-DNA glycosylase [Patescibacteria group bacterium]|nr:uracil-DNA glycosylase [Patescibacteria group bacterium]